MMHYFGISFFYLCVIQKNQGSRLIQGNIFYIFVENFIDMYAYLI